MTTSLFHFLVRATFAETASAAPAITPGPTTVSSTSIVSNLSDLTSKGMNALFLIGGVLAVLYLIWAGIQYINSAGSAEKAKSARGAIINAVIGVIVIVATFFFIRLAISLGNSISAAV